MLDCADIVAVLIVTGAVSFHPVDLHLQVGFPFGIDKLRVVDVLVLRQIGGSGDTSQPPCSNIGKGGKQRCNEKATRSRRTKTPQITGCRFMACTTDNAILSVADTACLARFPVFCACRAALAYCRFSFCFCHIPARKFFFSSGWLESACR